MTLTCNNLLDFCPPQEDASGDSSRRQLLAPLLRGGHGGDTRHPHYRLQRTRDLQEYHRRLDFDYGEPADDDAAPSGNILEYGGMFVSLGGEFVTTLSGNPLSSFKDMEAAKPVFIMMGFLMSITVLGYYICHRWQTYDRVYIKYVQNTTADKRYKRPSVVNLKNAFMEKTFVTQKRKSMLNFQEMGAKVRNDKARAKRDAASASGSGSGREHHPVPQDCDIFFDNIYDQSQSLDKGGYGQGEELEYEDCVPTLAKIKEHMPEAHCTAEKAEEMANLDKMGHKIATFFDTALPPTSLLEKSNGWTRFVRAVMREHDWFRIFSYSSLRLPRTIRFLSIISDILILLFVDSIFFGVLFPNDGHCTGFDNTTEEECELAPSKFESSSTLCFWDDETSLCAVRPPPATLEFYMIVAIVVTTFSILPEAICHWVLEEVCSLKPVFFKTIHKHDSTNLSGLADDSDSDGEGSIQLTSVALEEKWEAVKDKYMFKDGINTRKLYERYAYYDFTTPEEEAGLLLRFISSSLENRLKSAPIPWRNDRKAISGLSAANLEAIMVQLGIHADGSPVQLSWRKRVLCGTTPRQRVVDKISRVRRGVDLILNDMDNFSADLEEHQETALIQHFILEQLTPFKRYALRRQFFQFDCAEPEEIEGWKYVLGWAFMCTVWTFCVYWIFMWAILNSGPSMASWSYEIGFVIIQDVFVNDLVQVILVHVIAIEALRPQLKRIYVVLNQILHEKISTEACLKDDTQEEQEESWDFCVAQHLSAACRAARRAELHYLPFSQLLMRITDYDVAQCRDERGIHLSGFIVALLAIPTALALSNEVVQDMFLDVVLPTAWSCYLIGHAYALMLGPWALIVPYTLLLCALLYRQLVVVPRIRKRNKERANDVEGYKYDTREDLMWQNMNRQLQLVHLNTLNVVDYNPLRIQANTTSAGVCDSGSVRPLPSSRSTPRAGDDGEGSVMSEMSAPFYPLPGAGVGSGAGRNRGGSIGAYSEHSMEHSVHSGEDERRGQDKYDEVSLGEVSMGEESLSPDVLPAEIMQMQNHAARLEFIQPETSPSAVSSGPPPPGEEKEKRSLLGIASGVGRLLRWNKQQQQQAPHCRLSTDSDMVRELNLARGPGKGQDMPSAWKPPLTPSGPQYSMLHAGAARSSPGSNNSRASSPTSSVSTTGSGPLNPLVADIKSRKKTASSSGSSRGGVRGEKQSEHDIDNVLAALNFDSQRDVMAERSQPVTKKKLGRGGETGKPPTSSSSPLSAAPPLPRNRQRQSPSEGGGSTRQDDSADAKRKKKKRKPKPEKDMDLNSMTSF